MATTKRALLYQQVFEGIKSEIEGGKYLPKERIPSEPELAEQYGVSRITVRRAVEELCAEGYLVKQQGRGTFVSTPRINRRLLQYAVARSFTLVCEDNGMEPGARMVKCLIVPAGAEEARLLEIPEGALLLYIQRIRTADGQPIFEENIYLPYEEYRSLMAESLDDVSIFDKIAEVGGKRPAIPLKRTVEAVRATSEQASRLSVSQGDPLLFFNVCFADEERHPICIGRQYYVGSRYRFVL
ncbi:MAG: GntR family transcriptional regulator [Collinsella sp.]|nr:GntR family transcriptional regulator [Collinsella sp.]